MADSKLPSSQFILQIFTVGKTSAQKFMPVVQFALRKHTSRACIPIIASRTDWALNPPIECRAFAVALKRPYIYTYHQGEAQDEPQEEHFLLSQAIGK